MDRNPRFTRQLTNRLTGDTVENASLSRWSEQFSLTDQKNIIASTLGNLALVVEHQRFNTSGLLALHFGQNIVQVIERFDTRAESRRMVPNRTDGDDF